MAILKCPECGANVSDKAAACPNCGAPVNANAQPPQAPQQPQQPQQPWNLHPQPQGRSTTNILLIVLIAVLAVALVGGGLFFFLSKEKKASARDLEEEERIEKLEKEKKELSEKLEEEKTKKAFEEGKAAGAVATAGKQTTKVVTVPSGSGTPKVVINGTGVRFRFAPSLNAGYLTWPNGATRSVAKGSKLTYVGETGAWYQVAYLGHTFYVSKDFSYLSY